jgi:transcription initiation factor IIE alpha subunit
MASVFNIAYFLPILVNFFDDRIALIRVNVAKLSALILYYYNLKDEKTLDVFKKKFICIRQFMGRKAKRPDND